METEEIERLVEAAIEDSEATVRNPRSDGEHFEATVVSPAFEGRPLVEQHEMVYDALGEHMTTDIHALELSTYTPEEFAEYGSDAPGE